MGRLDELDLSLELSEEAEAERLEAGWARLEALRLALGGKLRGYGLGPPVCVLFEGWDASGKGGAIRRLVRPFDLRHVRVAQFSAPTPDEQRHHYMKRFWPVLPGYGGMTILDRSWYGRVLVERVDGLATEDEWRRAYGEIGELERWLTDGGMVLIKFFMHISDEEQLKRFEKRRDDPLKAWKLTDDDWENRGKRAAYLGAIEEMLARTDLGAAPWQLVEAENKKYARVKVVETVIERIERGMRDRGIEPPSLGT
ncbi:MAG: UDP-galactose-lipid carrier transferase [Actinomycetota bacterium]|nr:UDP-galactose-lipid carrier transferase [Actinomycetota bacterium]